MRPSTAPHRTHCSIVVAAVVSGLALAACGSSGTKPSSTASLSSHYGQAVAFSKCMRSHGVTNFPDPSGGGGGGIHISISSSSGINPFSPSFKAAQATCGKLLPGGGPSGHGAPSKSAIAALLKVAECMRAHGVSGFPDPTTTPPSGPAGFGVVLGRDGVFLAVPKTVDLQSPAAQQAAKICGFGGP